MLIRLYRPTSMPERWRDVKEQRETLVFLLLTFDSSSAMLRCTCDFSWHPALEDGRRIVAHVNLRFCFIRSARRDLL